LGGKWSFPKGRCEEGETLYQAALREAREEAGIDLSGISSYATIKLRYGTYFFFKLNKAFDEIALAPPSTPEEVLEVKWMKRKTIIKDDKNADVSFYFKQNYEFRRALVSCS
jgi:8-oxo-dGTP pyrophosphatase MutT (NUDIX family)